MGIFFIIMILSWAILAFLPSWLEITTTAKTSEAEENVSVAPPFIVPTFQDTAMSLSGPATATVFEARRLDSEFSIDSRDRSRASVEHISVERRRDGAQSVQQELTIFNRDYVLRSGSRFLGNISVNGTVRIEQDALLEGNISASKSVVVSQNSKVSGDIQCNGDIRLEAGAKVTGSLITDRDIWIYENARVGVGDFPVAVRGNEVIVAPTARIHGAIWARRDGVNFPEHKAA